MEKHRKLLAVTGDERLREWLDGFCERHSDIEVSFCSDVAEIERSIIETAPDSLLLDTTLFSHFSSTIIPDIRKASPFLPIVGVVDAQNGEARRATLAGGVFSTVDKMICDDDEFYCTVCNAANWYRERSEVAREVAEMSARCESDRLNLLELELVKGLSHMIGETEEPVSVLKHGFSLIRNYLSFDVFAALIQRRGEEEIYVYPNAAVREEIAEAIPGTLIRRMAKLAQNVDRPVRVVIQGSSTGDVASSEDLRSIIVPLVTGNAVYGYAGIYRGNPFDYKEESVFKRFCSHIATALQKINLFEEIKALSTNDGLTGLYNHTSILARLDQEIQRSNRYGSPLSVLMLDIDNFKEINDTHGHLAGDAILAEMAGLLRSAVRGIDSIGRYGGEEFLVILPETDALSAGVMADRLRAAVEKRRFRYDKETVQVTLSGGVASYRDDRSASELIGIADENLYVAKKEGKNRVYDDEER